MEIDSVVILYGPLVGSEILTRKIDRQKWLAQNQVNMLSEMRIICVPLEIKRKMISL
jgi:hypothetical protein